MFRWVYLEVEVLVGNALHGSGVVLYVRSDMEQKGWA